MLRRNAVLAVAGLVLPVVAAAGEIVPAARLVWLDPTGVALGTEAVVRPEVARLLRGIGVEANWRRAEPHELARPGELRVIFLDRTAERAHGFPVLGATPPTFQGERFVWIHVPSVRTSAGLERPGAGWGLDLHSTRQLGIALSRVITHELVHALAPHVPHGTGLMSARLDRRLLTAANLALDPELGLAVRSALLGAAPLARPVARILAAESSYREAYR